MRYHLDLLYPRHSDAAAKAALLQDLMAAVPEDPDAVDILDGEAASGTVPAWAGPVAEEGAADADDA